MCLIEAHGKKLKSVNKHKPVNYETRSGGAIPLTLNLSKEECKSFVITLNFIEGWFKLFKISYDNQTAMFCE